MRGSLLYSLLELGHATSENLAFTYRPRIRMNYGEDVIADINLLELRRRHPSQIQLYTFGSKRDSRTLPDSEWHLIGRARQLRMRVAATRLQQNGGFRITGDPISAAGRRIENLIEDGRANSVRPVVCIYGSEGQRTRWKSVQTEDGFSAFQAGCLFANAEILQSKRPILLSEIEASCVPWHYLARRNTYYHQPQSARAIADDLPLSFFSLGLSSTAIRTGPPLAVVDCDFPTFDELNAFEYRGPDRDGITELSERGYAQIMKPEQYLARGIARLIVFDVRGDFAQT